MATGRAVDTGFGLLIGGEWRDGSGGTYPVVNPATEEVVGEAPEATADDARAARGYRPRRTAGLGPDEPRGARPACSRPWPIGSAERAEELLPLIIAETGATLSVGSALQVPMVVTRFERYAQGALTDLTIPLPPGDGGHAAGGGRPHGRRRRAPTGRRGGLHRRLQLPDDVNMAGKVAPALADGQHRRHEAGAAGSAHGDRAGPHLRRGRVPARRGQRRHRLASRARRRRWSSPRDVDMVSFTGCTGGRHSASTRRAAAP